MGLKSVEPVFVFESEADVPDQSTRFLPWLVGEGALLHYKCCLTLTFLEERLQRTAYVRLWHEDAAFGVEPGRKPAALLGDSSRDCPPVFLELPRPSGGFTGIPKTTAQL